METSTQVIGLTNPKQSRAVSFTGVPVFCAIGVGLLFALSRPLIGISLANSSLKHIPLALFVLALTFHLIGRSVSSGRKVRGVWSGIWQDLWPLLTLGAYATTGSLYARFALAEQETFLNLGVYLLTMPLFFLWAREQRNEVTIVRPLVLLWGGAVWLAILGSIAQREHGQPLHESEFLVVPFFIYTCLASKERAGRVLSIVMLVLSAVLTGKLTGYLIGLAGIAYLVALQLGGVIPERWRGLTYALSSIILVICIGILTSAYLYFRDYLPSGNANVRLHQYYGALGEFMRSPLWGQAYTGVSGFAIRQGSETLTIPTHSDVLDLLKAGGLLGFGLWLLGIIKSMKALAHCRAEGLRSKAYIQAMSFMTVATVFSYCFNPLLLKAPQSFVIWGLLATAVSVATDARAGQFNGH